jgi:hypothetical protein
LRHFTLFTVKYLEGNYRIQMDRELPKSAIAKITEVINFNSLFLYQTNERDKESLETKQTRYTTLCNCPSDGIALGNGLGDRGFESRQGQGIFLFTTASKPALRPTHPPNQCVPGTLSLGVKRQEREADHSPPSSAGVKECVELYLHSPNRTSWRGDELKHRDKFIFTFTFTEGCRAINDPMAAITTHRAARSRSGALFHVRPQSKMRAAESVDWGVTNPSEPFWSVTKPLLIL